MHLPWGKIAVGALVVVVSFLGSIWAMTGLGPGAGQRRPALAEVPPLKPVARTSVVVTPAAIALAAIRDALERAAPRDLTGKRENPLSQLLSNAEIGWSVARGTRAVGRRTGRLALPS